MLKGHPREHKLAACALIVIALTRLFGFLTTSSADRAALSEPVSDVASIAALGFA